MTPAKMFEGDLWVLASHAVQMAQNAYKNGQTDEREECAKLADRMDACQDGEIGKAIRARGQA
jgi:uncharacterized protein (DUF305 family)